VIKIKLPENIDYYSVNELSYGENFSVTCNMVDSSNKNLNIIFEFFDISIFNLNKSWDDNDGIYPIGEVNLYKVEKLDELDNIFTSFELQCMNDSPNKYYLHTDAFLCMDILCGKVYIIELDGEKVINRIKLE